MKEAWTALDNRLKRNEELKESIILEMMGSKAGKLVNRFIVLEIISVIVCILAIPFCVFQLDRRMGINLPHDIIMFSCIAICSAYPFWGIYIINGLMKFDLTKDVGNNIYYVNKYNIQRKREFKFVAYFIGPAFAILGIFGYASLKVTLPLWSFLFCVLIAATLFLYWANKKQNKSIDSILRSLDEIKELKED